VSPADGAVGPGARVCREVQQRYGHSADLARGCAPSPESPCHHAVPGRRRRKPIALLVRGGGDQIGEDLCKRLRRTDATATAQKPWRAGGSASKSAPSPSRNFTQMLPTDSGTGAAFRARISRMIGTGVRNNAEHRANRIGDASGYKKGTVRKHANDRI
jgi:hypothetical protein